MTKKKKTKVSNWMASKGAGDVIFKQMPFILFVSFWTLVMVYNVHNGQKALRKIEKLRAELQEIRWYASSVQSKIMSSNTQSEVLKRMRSKDIGLVGSSPQRIISKE